MLSTLSLVLPSVVPSWRFFQTIEPSPRVQWRDASSSSQPWHELNPRAHALTVLSVAVRLFWNAARSDELFVVSCAERILQNATAHSIGEIQDRVQACANEHQNAAQLQFRLVTVHRGDKALIEETVFLSQIFCNSKEAVI